MNSKAALEAVSLSKSYRNTNVVSDISFALAPGMIAGLRGPSGAGKTTILRLLAGLEREDSGGVILNGQPLAASERPSMVTICFQHYTLWPHLTCGQNITLALDYRTNPLSTGQRSELAARLDIAHLLDRYPRQLSGGQRQRIALLRALALRPAFLLLDEPTSALDDESTETVLAILREQAADGTGVLISSHDRYVLDSSCVEIHYLAGGRLQAEAAGLRAANDY